MGNARDARLLACLRRRRQLLLQTTGTAIAELSASERKYAAAQHYQWGMTNITYAPGPRPLLQTCPACLLCDSLTHPFDGLGHVWRCQLPRRHLKHVRVPEPLLLVWKLRKHKKAARFKSKGCSNNYLPRRPPPAVRADTVPYRSQTFKKWEFFKGSFGTVYPMRYTSVCGQPLSGHQGSPPARTAGGR